MTLEMDPPDDLDEEEREVWERGARAGIRWIQSVVSSLEVGGDDRDPPALDPEVQEDGSCPNCGGDMVSGLGEQDECRRCGYRP